jgi:hypothetical protein
MSAAGALAARFSALSMREKALLAGCLLAVVVLAAARWVVMPARAEYGRNRAAIPARRAVLMRYEALRQGQDRIDEELFDQVRRMENWEEGLLTGETSSAAGVYLQGLLKPLTQRSDTRVTSIRALPPVKKGPYAEVAVQMEIQTTTEGLGHLLADLSRQPKILVVRKLSATTGAYYAAQGQRKEIVAISLVVAGLSAAPVDEKPSGGGGE